MWWNILLVIIGLVTYWYYKVTKKWDFFAKAGIAYDKPYFPFGSAATWKSFTGQITFFEPPTVIAKKHPNEPVLGYYSFGSPIVVLNSVEMVKNVLVKDFDHFMDRRTLLTDSENKILKAANRMMLSLEGDEWRVIRAKMSPVFTSGKLKGMTNMINVVTENLIQHLGVIADKGEELDAKKTTALYSLDTIATCGFGVECNSFKNPDGDMNRMAQKVLNPGGFKMVEIITIILLPSLAKLLGFTFFNVPSLEYFYNVIKAAMKQRQEPGNVRRNDFIDHILDALRDKKLEQDEQGEQFEEDAKVTTEKKLNLTEEELERDMVANTLLFFFAGLDTSSTIMAVFFLVMAQKEDAQEQLYQEIKETVDESKSGTLDYKTIQEMPLLDAAIHETLRYYPLGLLERKCSKDYKVPGTDMVIEKGMMVQIPTVIMHRDPNNFPYPTEYNFDNFSPEAKANRSPYAYMGFGQGPRNCIGMRFALMQVKLALIQVMYNFKIVAGPKTVKEIVIEPTSTNGLPKSGVWVKMERRY